MDAFVVVPNDQCIAWAMKVHRVNGIGKFRDHHTRFRVSEIPHDGHSIARPGKKYLLSGARDARLKMWDTSANYAQASEVVAHMFAINHLAFSPDSKHFVTCSMDKSIKVWDAQSLKLLKVIDRSRHAGHGTSVNKVLWTGFHNQLLSASDDRTISVWNINFEKQPV